MSAWITITYRRKRVSPAKKKYLPATPDNILTLHRSAGLSAKGVLTLVVRCTDDISQANANMQYYAFKEIFFFNFSHKLWWTWRSEESLIWNVTWGHRSLQVIQASCSLSFLPPVLEEQLYAADVSYPALRWHPVSFWALFSPPLSKYWNDYKWNRVWEQKMWYRLHTISRGAACDTLTRRAVQRTLGGISQCERDGVCRTVYKVFILQFKFPVFHSLYPCKSCW